MEQAVDSLPEDGQISEWGSGGSTTMFVELLKPKQHLVSIEHNPQWFSKVGRAIKDHPNCERVNYIFSDVRVKIQKGNHEYVIDHNYWGYGDPPEENPIFLQHYIHPKLKNTDIDVFNSDLYLVDGIARAAVLASIFIKAKKRDALVYVHDYVGREDWYEWAVSAYSKREIVGHTLCKLTF